MTYEIPAGAVRILETLEAAGHEAYLVGGCVRTFCGGPNRMTWTSAPQRSQNRRRRVSRGARC